MHDDAGLGTVGLDADHAGEHGIGAEALAQHGDVVEAVQQRQHQRRLRPTRSSADSSPDGLGGDDQRVDVLLQAGNVRGWATNSPKLTLLTRNPRAEIASAVAS